MSARTWSFLVGLFLVAGCETTSHHTAQHANDRADDPGSSKLWGILAKSEGTGEAAAQPAAGPVRVALFRTAVAPDLKKTLNGAKLFELWRKEFAGDPAVRLVSQDKVDKAQRKEAQGNYSFFRLGDAVRVYSVATHRMRAGYDRQARKVVQVPQLVLTARVEWKVAGTERKVSVEGSFLKNLELLRELAAKVKAVVAAGPDG